MFLCAERLLCAFLSEGKIKYLGIYTNSGIFTDFTLGHPLEYGMAIISNYFTHWTVFYAERNIRMYQL